MSQQIIQNAGKALTSVTGFLKTLAKNAPALALTAAAVPNIMDFMRGLTSPFEEVGEAVEDLGFTASEGFEQMATDISDAIYDLEPVAEQLGGWVDDAYDDIQAKDWDALQEDVDTGISAALDSVVAFFDDDTLMDDIGSGVAAIVSGIFDSIGNIDQEDVDAMMDGIGVAMTAFFNNLDYPTIFAGLLNAFVGIPAMISKKIGEEFAEWATQDMNDAERESWWAAFAAGVRNLGGY